MSNKINLARLNNLITGDELPVDFADEVFVAAYSFGIDNKELMDLMLQFKDLFDTDAFNLYVYKIFLLGYSMGQRAHNEVLEASVNQANNKSHVTQ